MTPAERLANSEATLRHQGFAPSDNGTWLGRHYRAVITDMPTIETDEDRALGATPAFIIEYKAYA